MTLEQSGFAPRGPRAHGFSRQVRPRPSRASHPGPHGHSGPAWFAARVETRVPAGRDLGAPRAARPALLQGPWYVSPCARSRGGGVVHTSGRWRERRFGCEGDVTLRAGRAGPGRPGQAGHGAGPPASRAHGGLGREDPGLGRGWGAPRSFQRARGGRALPRDGTSAGRGPASEPESGGAPAAWGDRRPPPVIPIILQFGGQRTVPRGL